MEKELAEKVYLYIIENIKYLYHRFNQYTLETFDELSPEEIYSDSVFEDLYKLEVKAGCNADSHDSIPPNNKLLGILPNKL